MKNNNLLICKMLLDKGLSDREVAEKMGVTRRSIFRYKARIRSAEDEVERGCSITEHPHGKGNCA